MPDARHERISKARLRLLHSYPFFGSLVSRLTITIPEKTDCATACVSKGGFVTFNPEFMDTLTDPELAFILCHEVLHVALGYWSRQGNRKAILFSGDHMISAWNVAHDYAINSIINKVAEANPRKWIACTKNCCLDAKYDDWAAEKIYDDILENTPTLEEFMADISGDGEGSEEEQKQWEHNLRSAMQEHQHRQHGTLPLALQQYVESLTPQVSWPEKLAQWLGDNYGGMSYSYRRPSRRQEGNDSVLSALDRHNLPDIVILWDTSGSMASFLSLVFSELDSILRVFDAPIRVVLCDCAIQGDFRDLRQAESMAEDIKGGGGSDFTPAFELIDDTNAVVLAFTDGYITVPPKVLQQVLWVLTPDGVDPTGGTYGSIVRLQSTE